MLVLTRKEGERIRIGDDIEIVIYDLGNSRCKIAIYAPPEMRISRVEPDKETVLK
jgi:carbon storage regulator